MSAQSIFTFIFLIADFELCQTDNFISQGNGQTEFIYPFLLFHNKVVT